MLTPLLMTMTLTAPAAFDNEADETKQGPRKELFAKEGWYRKVEAKEQEFVGTLEKVDRGGLIGFGRFNPYRLKMEKDVREVYVGGKPKLLADYVGKRVKITGKPVDMAVEGKRHREIWPARIELAPEKKGAADPARRESPVFTFDDETKAPKIIARANWRASARPGAAAQQLVIRGAAEAAKAMGLPDDGKGRQMATERLTRAFRVDKLDWNNQMVIVVTAGAKRTGGYSVAVTGLETKGDSLVVKWKLKSPGAGDIVTQAFTHPAQSILTKKVKGKVTFDPPAPKGK